MFLCLVPVCCGVLYEHGCFEEMQNSAAPAGADDYKVMLSGIA